MVQRMVIRFLQPRLLFYTLIEGFGVVFSNVSSFIFSIALCCQIIIRLDDILAIYNTTERGCRTHRCAFLRGRKKFVFNALAVLN